MVWYGMAWYGMVWYGMVWYGMVWYGMVWYGMVWYGMVWYGMAWYGIDGMVWYGMALYGNCKCIIGNQTLCIRIFGTKQISISKLGKLAEVTVQFTIVEFWLSAIICIVGSQGLYLQNWHPSDFYLQTWQVGRDCSFNPCYSIVQVKCSCRV